MKLLYCSTRVLILIAIATILTVFINKGIADILFYIFMGLIVMTGISLILLIMKNIYPKGAPQTRNSPYYSPHGQECSSNITMGKQITQAPNSHAHTDGINTSYKNSQNCEQCFISFHDILLPPTMTLIIKRILRRQTTNANKTKRVCISHVLILLKKQFSKGCSNYFRLNQFHGFTTIVSSEGNIIAVCFP